jgi:hypothetical protein
MASVVAEVEPAGPPPMTMTSGLSVVDLHGFKWTDDDAADAMMQPRRHKFIRHKVKLSTAANDTHSR